MTRGGGAAAADEAIGAADGVRFKALDPHLMSTAVLGLFRADEREAPIGGYLLTACLRRALRLARA